MAADDDGPDAGRTVTSEALRLVLVDDDEPIRRLTRLWIEDDARFAVVGEASSGLEAIDSVRTLQPDVVLLDIAMPGMDGLSAVSFLRTAAPEASIVLYTNHLEMAEAGLHRGAAALFSKSEALADVLRAIVELRRAR